MCRRNWREAGVLVLGRPPVECRFIIAFMFLQIGTTCRSPLLVLVPEECPSQVCQLILGISYPSSTSSFPACLYGQGFSPRDQVTYHMLHRKLGLHCRPEHIPIHAARCARSRSVRALAQMQSTKDQKPPRQHPSRVRLVSPSSRQRPVEWTNPSPIRHEISYNESSNESKANSELRSTAFLSK